MSIRTVRSKSFRHKGVNGVLDRLEDRLAPAQLLPDFQVLTPAWQVSDNVSPYLPGQSGGNYRFLEFDTGLANYGQGPFELRGTTTIITEPDGSQSQLANQRIYTDDGKFIDRPAGYMVYHPTHSHVHFEDMAWGVLRQRLPGDIPGDIVAVGPKTSFCLIDIQHSKAELPGSPTNSVYNSCGTAVQGISVGWNDVYSMGLDGQWIDITGIPNGDYFLEIVADVADRILETDETNNTTRVPITLTGLPAVNGFRVTESTPLGGNFSPVDHVDLTFNQDVNPATFTTADVVFTGPSGVITPTAVTPISSKEFRVTFPIQNKTGTYLMTIGPNINSASSGLLDQNNNNIAGEAGDKYTNIFTIAPPRISTITPAGETGAPVTSVRVTFNMLMDSATFDATDVLSFTGPGGLNLVSAITNVTPVTAGGQSLAFDVNFAAQTATGAYALTIGANIQDTFGRLVDQNINGTSNEAADASTVAFSIAAPRIVLVTPGGTLGPPVQSIRVTYNALMNSSTFTAADIISFTDPTNASLIGSITGVVPVTSGGQSQAFDINFSSQSVVGTYNLKIGANVEDAFGRLVDQNKDGTANGAGDEFSHSFQLAIPGVYGPDAFGYRGFERAYQTVTLSAPTNLSFSDTDDGNAKVNLLTNTFNFYGTNYTGQTLFASTNGLITFGTGNNAYNNSAGLNSISQPAIAVLWDDWKINTSGSAQVRYQLRDTDSTPGVDQLAIEWLNTRHYDVTGTVNFQALLELNTGNRPGRITLNYADLETDSPSYSSGAQATVGIKAPTAVNSSLIVAHNQSGHPLLGSARAVEVSVPFVQSITRVNPTPAPDGDVEFLVTFSEPILTIDELDFAVVAPTLTGAFVDHIHSTANPAVFEVHVITGTGSGSLRLDLIDNETIVSLFGAPLGGKGKINGDFTAGETYTIVQQPAQVDGLFIGDGSGERSIVQQVRVDFDKTVVFSGAPADAFQLTGPSGAVPVFIDLSSSSAEQTRAIIRFSPVGQPLVTLPDGKYTLTVLASNITTGGVTFDGDNNGTPGGNYVTQFHRLAGDANGDGITNAADFAVFRSYFGTTNGLSMFDFDNDGSVGITDFAIFRSRFGMSI